MDGAEGVEREGNGSSEKEGAGDAHSSPGRRSVPVDGSPIVRVTTDDSPGLEGFVESSTRPPCSMTLCKAEWVGGDDFPAGARSVTTTAFPTRSAEGSLTANLSFSSESGMNMLPFTRAVMAF